MKSAPLAIAVILAIAACTAAVPASSPPDPVPRTESPGPVSEQVARTQSPSPIAKYVPPPILTEEEAIQVGLRRARMSFPEVTEGRNVRNPKARLMTLEEAEKLVLGGGPSYRPRSMPVWVVAVEGEWSAAGIAVAPSVTPTVAMQGLEIIDARTGDGIGGSRRNKPLDLDAAQGLDPEAFSTYPLKVSLSYAKELADFPVSQPAFLPDGFSLAEVRLELSDPLKDLIFPESLRQTVIQEYTDGTGNIIHLAQDSRNGLPDSIPGANRTAVHHNEAWESHTPGGPTWLTWIARYRHPEPLRGRSVTHTLFSPSGSVGLDVLHRIAESLLPGEPPLPTSTPAVPISVPTPAPAATSAPTPAPPTPTPTQAPGATVVPTPVPTPHAASPPPVTPAAEARSHLDDCGNTIPDPPVDIKGPGELRGSICGIDSDWEA